MNTADSHVHEYAIIICASRIGCDKLLTKWCFVTQIMKKAVINHWNKCKAPLIMTEYSSTHWQKCSWSCFWWQKDHFRKLFAGWLVTSQKLIRELTQLAVECSSAYLYDRLNTDEQKSSASMNFQSIIEWELTKNWL